MLRVIIVDDEPLARENLYCLLKKYSEIDVIAECGNAVDAISQIHRLHPEAIFVDIQMPRIDGLEMIKMIDPIYMPHIVFLTAYDDYAVQAFEQQAFDYLLKPIEHVRFDKTIHRLMQKFLPQDIHRLPNSEIPLKYIPCTGHSKIYLFNPDEVLFINSRIAGNYVTTMDGQDYITDLTLQTLEARTDFVRCHRQYLINMLKLKEIRFNTRGQPHLVLSNGAVIPVSRRHFKDLKARLSL